MKLTKPLLGLILYTLKINIALILADYLKIIGSDATQGFPKWSMKMELSLGLLESYAINTKHTIVKKPISNSTVEIMHLIIRDMLSIANLTRLHCQD